MFFPLENATVLSGKQKNNKGAKAIVTGSCTYFTVYKIYMSINV